MTPTKEYLISRYPKIYAVKDRDNQHWNSAQDLDACRHVNFTLIHNNFSKGK